MPIITLGATGESRHSLMIEAMQTEGGEMAAITDINLFSPILAQYSLNIEPIIEHGHVSAGLSMEDLEAAEETAAGLRSPEMMVTGLNQHLVMNALNSEL